MYERNDEQGIRKLNYSRYRKLVEKGYSIAEDTANTSLYYINEDPFGRTYYQKSLGEVTIRDPLTGRMFTQEEWATKEFIVDNKAQLVAKVSADLIVGKKLSVKFVDTDNPSEEKTTWLDEFVKRNKLLTRLYESAIRNSGLGDQYFELEVQDGKIKVVYRDPYYVDIEYENDTVKFYEIAWEIDVEKPISRSLLKKKRQKTTYIQKKLHYSGMIRWEMWEQKKKDMIPVPLNQNPENEELIERALKEPHMKTLLAKESGEEYETNDVNSVYIVEEYTGIDTFLLIHWPNYRMFDLFGVSDVGIIENLQNALNNRQTQLHDILDKHADPAMYGNDSYLDENGNLVMTGGGGRFFPVTEGGEPPGYLVWNGRIADSQEEIKRLYEAILDNTETAAALLGRDEGGIASGRALMYKLIRSLAMAARKSGYMKTAVGEMILTAQKLYEIWIKGSGVASPNEEIKTDWGDLLETTIEIQSAIPTDTKEIITEVAILVEKGLVSKETGLEIIEKYFDEINAEVEKKRLAVQEDREVELEKKRMPDLLAGIPEEPEEPGLTE